MSTVLTHQLEASEKSADELEAELRHQSRRATLCYDVQDLSSSLVNLFNEIGRDVERWRDDLRAADQSQRDVLLPMDRLWHSLFTRLAPLFERCNGLFRAMEAEGFRIDGKEPFNKAWRELRGIACFSLEEVAAAAEQIRRGEAKSLAEVTRELWD